MDACPYCKNYHPEWQVCDGIIKAVEKGTYKKKKPNTGKGE